MKKIEEQAKSISASSDDFRFHRPGYHQLLDWDGEIRWVADTPDDERQRAVEKRLSVQGVPDEVIETVLWLNHKLANETATKTPVRKPGTRGRKPSLTPAQIEEGINILSKQPRMSTDAARRTLRDAGIDTNNTSLYVLVIGPAYSDD